MSADKITPRTDSFHSPDHLACDWAEFARQLERELANLRAQLADVTLERDTLLGINAAWKRDYGGAMKRGDNWMEDCRRAEAQLAERDKELAALKGHAEALCKSIASADFHTADELIAMDAYRAAYPKEDKA